MMKSSIPTMSPANTQMPKLLTQCTEHSSGDACLGLGPLPSYAVNLICGQLISHSDFFLLISCYVLINFYLN